MFFAAVMRVAVAILPEVRELLGEDPTQLEELLEEIHDEDLADLLQLLNDTEAMLLLEQLTTEEAADIFERLDEHEQTEMVEHFGPERLAPIVSEMAPDDRTDFIEALPDSIGGELLDAMAPEAAAEVEELIRWPEDTAGSLMTTDVVRLAPDIRMDEAIKQIRAQAEHAETIYSIYAVDEGGILQGVASLRDILVAESDARFVDVMTEHVHTVAPGTDQEEVARMLHKYDFTALPVVDAQMLLLGVITVDDVMDVIEQEQDEDVQRLAAVEPMAESYFNTDALTMMRKRAPWLAVLFMGQFITEGVMRHYDPVIQAVTQLTFYLPLLISTGGNSGSQSASLIIRGLATGDVSTSDWSRILSRELIQGLALGLLLAAIGLARVWTLGDAPRMAVTIALTVVSIVLLGCTIGAMLPLLLQRLGLDPATSSTPFVATIVDVVGILLYFTLAKIIFAGVLAAPTPG